VKLDSRQQRFAVRVKNTYSTKTKKLHRNSTLGAPICRIVRKDHEHGQTIKGMNWPSPGKNQYSGPLYWNTRLQPQVSCSAGQEESKPKSGPGSGCVGQIDGAQTMAEWEQQQCVNPDMNRAHTAAFVAPDIGRSSKPSW